MASTTVGSLFVTPDRSEDRFLPEGPHEVAVEGQPAVAWVNIQTAPDATAGAIHLRFWDSSERHAVPVPGRPGFFAATDRANTVLVGATKTVGLLSLASGQWEPLATIPDDNPRTIINDGEIVPGGGAVVFGTKDVKFADAIAELYLFTAVDRRITKLTGGQICSNGKVFARDRNGLVLFHIDTPQKAVTRYRLDIEKRSLTKEGVSLDLRSVPAFPDGMCDVGDGTVIIAFFNPDLAPAGRAARYNLGTRELVEEWTTPGSPRVTCPLLVKRPDGVKLILTTADEGMAADMRKQCPNAGCLFIADTTITEIPPSEVVKLS